MHAQNLLAVKKKRFQHQILKITNQPHKILRQIAANLNQSAESRTHRLRFCWHRVFPLPGNH